MFTKHKKTILLRIIIGLIFLAFLAYFWISSYNEIGWNLFGIICPLAIVIAFGWAAFYATKETTAPGSQIDIQVSSDQSANQVVQPQKTETVAQVTTAPPIISKQLLPLITELQSGNARQRRAASYKLGKSQDPAVVSVLIDAFNDSDSIVRNNVVDGLRKIGTEDALAFLGSHKILTKPSLQYDQFLTIEADGNLLKFKCPSCKKHLRVYTSSFLSGSTQNDIPHVRSSGHYRKVSTRGVNILVYILVAIGAGVISGNIIVSVIAGLVAMATYQLWGGWIVNAFGKSIPIWIITCPECQSDIGCIKYEDTEKETFEILNKPTSEEEIQNL